MANTRIDIRSIRRDQIIEAALVIIAEQGLQNLSLSAIEEKAGMSRGQLTYYFPAKEDILLAVFDRVLQLMYQRLGGLDGCERPTGGWAMVQALLQKLVGQPPVSPEFHCLQYTFLSQIAHRDDFRRRLASLYEEWRSKMAADLAADWASNPAAPRVSPRAVATLVQAILHGLAMQSAADPKAFDREEMVELCLDVLGNYLKPRPLAANGSKRIVTDDRVARRRGGKQRNTYDPRISAAPGPAGRKR